MTNNKQQTAVGWLEERLILSFGDELKPLIGFFIIAKEMEKERMLECYLKADVFPRKYEFEKWYNETYGNNHIGDVNEMVGGKQ